MLEHDRRVRLVAVLAASTRAADELLLEVSRIDVKLSGGGFFEHGHGHRARVRATALFIRRYTLESVAASLALERFFRFFAFGSEE